MPSTAENTSLSIRRIEELIEGRILCGFDQRDASVQEAFASDLMSDVLRLKSTQILLITGLVNMQAIRTAEMSDISFIILARGKKASKEMIELAEENDMVLIETAFSMFRTSGILFANGLKPIY